MITKRRIEENNYVDSLEFSYFDPMKDIIEKVKNATITITGKRRSGKSYLIRHLCYLVRNEYENVYLFSGTADSQGDFWDFIPKKNIFYGLDETALNEIWEYQKQRILKSNEKDKNKMPHVLVIFDDIIGDKSGARNCDFLYKLYANGRHLNICSILATQSLKMISKHARDNTDISIAYWFKNRDDKDDFSTENFCSTSQYVSEKIIDKITGNQDYHAIVALNYKNSSNILDTICKFKANEHVKKFTIGEKIRKLKNQSTYYEDRVFTVKKGKGGRIDYEVDYSY